MKTLKPFANTFFSEWYLRPEREQEELRRKSQEAKVGDLISLDDQGKGKEVEEDQPWTTESGMDAGFHAGLCAFLVPLFSPSRLRTFPLSALLFNPSFMLPVAQLLIACSRHLALQRHGFSLSRRPSQAARKIEDEALEGLSQVWVRPPS